MKDVKHIVVANGQRSRKIQDKVSHVVQKQVQTIQTRLVAIDMIWNLIWWNL
jgi:hypothetical protein